ncbi:Predicted NAD/FAD-binding protein [Fontimonas thermophila]|uniref:Predicted NAD/FAD-binding protein n=1 Tax=Fontimonas thermophila TaxID=1076937 RepID=A0A1I2ICV2_9GAMM|nr:FAD-dependent oxidoreductase [Fontimonas thermophila]SFF39483.1 Predicted NAD/FAD-binding protein [Fontimonas thermophila]
MRVAVIGGGISGLVCAYLLRTHHEVVLFEGQDRLGGHSHTVDVEWQGVRYAIDTGFIVCNDRTYPNFMKLLGRLGVTRRKTQMSFSVSCERSGIEYGSSGLDSLFAQRRNLLRLDHYRMLIDILRFNRRSRELLKAPCGLALGDYLAGAGYSEPFVRRYLLPMCAAIWSGSIQDASRFPADHFVQFFENHGLLTIADQPQWYVIEGGSRAYVARIAEALGSAARTACPVQRVRRGADAVEVQTPFGSERFDHVIFACHSDEALALLADPSEREREILGALPYQPNDVVLHHDERLLPANRRAWASWNYRVGAADDAPATVTYHMNRLQSLRAPVQFCVSLNQTERIDPAKVLRRFVYEHPVYTQASRAARARRAEIDGIGVTHYCGAYWENGFHEDGVRTALHVVHRLGGRL